MLKPLLLFFLSLATLPATSLAEAVDAHYLQDLQSKVDSEHLATSRPWLLLGHYRQRWFGGYYSEVAGQAFFISPVGKTDPAAELHATLAAFADVTAPKLMQCQYMARRNWLFEKLQIDVAKFPRLACETTEGWKKKLNADGASIIFASAYLNNAASMFGHTFLKFHSRDNHAEERDLLNYGVSFAANTGGLSGGFQFAVYGLFGGYPGTFSMLPYHQTLQQYANLEGRDIWEYRLNLTSKQLDTLINHLLELEKTYFDYYFFDANCSYQLLAALEVANPDLHLTDQFFYFVIPADTIRLMARNPELLQDVTFRPALITQFRAQAGKLEHNDLALVNPLVDGTDFASTLLKVKARPLKNQEQILDASLSLSAVRQVHAQTAYEKRAYQIKVARASLGVPSEPLTSESFSETRPEMGHDSSRFGLGFGVKSDRTFEPLTLRMAYQDLLSHEAGYLNNMNLDVLRIGARVYNPVAGDATTQVQIKEISFFDILSASAVDQFFQPLAWRADFGLNRPDDRPFNSELALTANGGVGSAIEPIGHVFTLMSFARGHFDAARDLQYGHRLGASVQLQALLRPFERWRLNAGAEYRSYFLGETKSFPAYWFRQSISLSRNWELRLDYNRFAHQTEAQAQVLTHFLF